MLPNIRLLPFLSLAFMVTTCGLSGPQTSERTVIGVDQGHAFRAAHRALSERSFDFETVDRAGGKLVTSWRDQGMRSIRFEVTTSPILSSEAETETAVKIQVRALARDRAVDGWTKGYEVAQTAGRLARDIASAAENAVKSVSIVGMNEPEESEPEPQETPTPECSTSRECPPGRHCGSGRCVWECSADNECAGDERCDRRGRCVPRPPPPPPPASESEEEDAS